MENNRNGDGAEKESNFAIQLSKVIENPFEIILNVKSKG